MLEEETFKRKLAEPAKLEAYGFRKEGDSYHYQVDFLAGQFQAQITVQGNQVKGEVYDNDNHEPYLLLRAEGQHGAYVSSVRAAYGEILAEIATQCFREEPFLTPQANRLSQLVARSFHEKADYPFKKLPTYGVFRNADSNKWYGLVMNIDKALITKEKSDAGQEVEILNLKIKEAKRPKLLAQAGIYPAYHMNRANWVSIMLDERVSDDEILELLTESRAFTNQGGRPLNQPIAWIEPANPKYYDVAAAFAKKREIFWKQNTKVLAGDTVYIYLTAPVKALCYKCLVLEAGIESEEVAPKKLMHLQLVQEYPATLCPFSKLKELGVKAVRGARKTTQELDEYLAHYSR
ncbi:MmcQ/YjbR family DNA-binding protein [Ligilactobacillus equi]